MTQDWQNAFRHFDRDRSETIDAGELRDALAHFGCVPMSTCHARD